MDEYILINKTTSLQVFRGNLDTFGLLSVMAFWCPPKEFIKNWAAANNCDVFIKV